MMGTVTLVVGDLCLTPSLDILFFVADVDDVDCSDLC